MRNLKIVGLILLFMARPLISGQTIQRRQAVSAQIIPRCTNAEKLDFILDLQGSAMTWVTQQTVSIGNGYTVTVKILPDSRRKISLKSEASLIVKGPGLHSLRKTVNFNWADWNPSGSNTPAYEGYTFLRIAQNKTVVATDGLKQYTIEFTAGYIMAQPTHETPGRDWTVSFCYQGPTVSQKTLTVPKTLVPAAPPKTEPTVPKTPVPVTPPKTAPTVPKTPVPATPVKTEPTVPKTPVPTTPPKVELPIPKTPTRIKPRIPKTATKLKSGIPKTAAEVAFEATITKPDSNSRWYFQETKDIFIETNFKAHYFWIDLTSPGETGNIFQGPIQPYSKVNNTHKYQYRWLVPKPMSGNGTYRVRVKIASTQGNIEYFSDPFYLSEETTMKTSKVNLLPSIRNRYSRKIEAYDLDKPSDPQPSPLLNNRPGRMRVGFEHRYDPPRGGLVSWRYHGFIFRSQIVFPLDGIKDRIQLLLKAELTLTQETESFESNLAYGAGKMYVLTSPWSGRAVDTPGYFYKDLLQKEHQWVDVTEQVKDWLMGREPNHGFLIGAVDESFSHKTEVCCSFCQIKLTLTFREPQ